MVSVSDIQSDEKLEPWQEIDRKLQQGPMPWHSQEGVKFVQQPTEEELADEGAMDH